MPLKNRIRSTFTERPLRILILLNAPQNDWLGQELMVAIKSRQPSATFFGIGGDSMVNTGLTGLPGLPDRINFLALNNPFKGHFLKKHFLKRALIAQCAEKNIDAVITIGAADMFRPLVRQLKKKMSMPCFHYGEIHGHQVKSLKAYKQIFCFTPYEAEALKGAGLNASFVGHPLLAHFAEFIPSGEAKPLGSPRRLALVPGRRGLTIRSVMPAMAQVAQSLRGKMVKLDVLLPLANATNPRHFEPYNTLGAHYARGEEKHKAISGCDAALALAGESNLTLALFGVPMIAVKPKAVFSSLKKYKNKDTEGLTSPVNLLLGENVVPEVSVRDVTAMQANMENLLANTPERKQQLAAFKKVRTALRPPEDAPVPQVVASAFLDQLS